MKLRRLGNGSVDIKAARYNLRIDAGDRLALLRVKRARRRFMFFAGGACNPVGESDETLAGAAPSVSRAGDARVIALQESSSAWTEKTCFFVCREDSIEFFYTLKGRGQVERAQFFRGRFNGAWLGFAGDFDEIYTTAPNFMERLYYHPGEYYYISAGNNKTPMTVRGQALASPCHCMGLHDRRDKVYLSVGLAARPGRYTWDAMEWNPPDHDHIQHGLGGGFAALYDGKLHIDGEWESPRLVMTFARGRDKALPTYLKHCYKHGYIPRPRRRRIPGWWREPIYCTWHDQVALAHDTRTRLKQQINNFDTCTQELTDRWVRRLESKGCRPGIVILDAMWQEHLNTPEPRPELWPDMRAWIEDCHARDIRVFLWTAAWSKEGLPADECVTRDGEPVACDITNPKYERRFREMIRRWFSDAPDALNADGVKVDGCLGLPTGKGLSNHEGLWGLELQRRYLATLYDEAKKHKKDVCVSTYVANPYLADVTDMVRLGDMYTTRLTAHDTMLHRAEVYRQTMPYAALDTDGQFSHYMLDDYANEVAAQAEIGAPSLYTAEWVYKTRPFLFTRAGKLTASDYKEFARVFAAYRRKLRRGK